MRRHIFERPLERLMSAGGLEKGRPVCRRAGSRLPRVIEAAKPVDVEARRNRRLDLIRRDGLDDPCRYLVRFRSESLSADDAEVAWRMKK